MLARAQVSVTTPGEVRMRVSAPAGGGVWVDDRPVESVGDVTVKLARGVHSVSVLAAAKGAGVRTVFAAGSARPEDGLRVVPVRHVADALRWAATGGVDQAPKGREVREM